MERQENQKKFGLATWRLPTILIKFKLSIDKST